jgi:hypothetical protein
MLSLNIAVYALSWISVKIGRFFPRSSEAVSIGSTCRKIPDFQDEEDNSFSHQADTISWADSSSRSKMRTRLVSTASP